MEIKVCNVVGIGPCLVGSDDRIICKVSEVPAMQQQVEELKALNDKQSADIKLLRDALSSLHSTVDSDLIGDCDSSYAEQVYINAEKALAATAKE